MRIDVARPAPGHAVVVVAVLVIAVLSAGVVVATARTSADRAAGDARATGLGAATALDDLQPPAGPTSTATSVPAPTTTRPTTAVAKATPAPPTTKNAPTPAGSVQQPPGQKDPSSVTVPYQPGQSSWSGTSNAIALKVTHTYNAHGRQEIMFTAFADGCAGGGPIGTLFASFDIAPGASSAQGPTLPNVRLDTSVRPPDIDSDTSYVTVGGMVTDEDGFIQRLVLDWGDGTPAQILPGDRVECRSSRSGWPIPSMARIASSPVLLHRYTAPGVYQVTLTAISTACDGSQEQRGVGSLTWRVPG